PLPPRADPATAATRIEPPRRRASSTRPATKTGGGGAAKFFKRVAVAALLIGALVAAAVAGMTLGASKPAPVVKDNLQDQIDGLRGFIQDNS
ncbi:MAG: hypothetical protein WAP35_07000, partial [Solirubrobacterales bacterium]